MSDKFMKHHKTNPRQAPSVFAIFLFPSVIYSEACSWIEIERKKKNSTKPKLWMKKDLKQERHVINNRKRRSSDVFWEEVGGGGWSCMSIWVIRRPIDGETLDNKEQRWKAGNEEIAKFEIQLIKWRLHSCLVQQLSAEQMLWPDAAWSMAGVGVYHAWLIH